MILYDKGLIRLDEKANRYLPSNMQLPSEITVHHLLSHTSGLHNNYNFEDDFYVGEDRKPYHNLLSPKDLEKYTGTYLPGKIHIKQKNGKLYLVRVNQNIHIELYCVGKDSFKRRYEEQQTAHKLIPDGDMEPSVWGYRLTSKQFV